MEIGERIGSYLVTEVMNGGMSEVYRVMIDESPVRFVLKRCTEKADEEHVRLFKREIRILKSLDHPNIIKIIDAKPAENPPYYVMEACGKSLVDFSLSDNITQKIDLAIQMCEGIQYMHTHNVRHRDIKPQNILINRDGIVKIVDFGLSRFEHRDSTTLTRTDLAAGTQGYMPPEYKNGAFKEGTVEGDVYMLGKTLYFLFSKGGDVSNVQIGNVPFEIGAILDKSIKNEPSQRYSSVEPIIEALKDYLHSLKELDKKPKPIREIKKLYKSGSNEFRNEVFKALSALDDESQAWGNLLRHLTRDELIDVLKYKKDYIHVLENNFIIGLSNHSDHIQFDDIDEFTKFASCILKVSDDIALNQQLLSLLIGIAEGYTRWPSMEMLGAMLNSQIEKDEIHYKPFIYHHRKALLTFKEELRNNPFNSQITSILS